MRGEIIELICESCGVGNPPGTEFCLFCGSYLAWDRSVLVKPGQGRPAGPAAGQPGALGNPPVQTGGYPVGPQTGAGAAPGGAPSAGQSGPPPGGRPPGPAAGPAGPYGAGQGAGGTVGQAAFGGGPSGGPPSSAGSPTYPTSAGSPTWTGQPAAGGYPDASAGGDAPPWVVAAQLKNPKPRQAPPPQQTFVDEAATVPQSQASPATMPLPAATDPAFGRPGGYAGGPGQAAYAGQPAQQGQYGGSPQQGQYGATPNQQFGQGGQVPGGTCPRCQTVNDPTRRFCSKCGYVLIADNTVGANIPVRPQQPRSWWARLTGDSHDRAARRAYRRSLPPLYRWRRVLIGVLVLAVGFGGFSFFFHKSPLRWSLERWDDLRGATIQVTPVKARIEPQTATVQGSNPGALVDNTLQSWTGIWPPGTPQGESCTGGASTWTIVIETARSTRIREVDITAGLGKDDPNRALQARPKAIGIILDGDAANCRSWVLKDDPATQVLKLDSVTGVREVRIVVNTTYPEPQDGQHVLSITEISLRSRPRR